MLWNTPLFPVVTPLDRKDYRQAVALLSDAAWPEFMMHDPISDQYWSDLFTRFPEFQFALWDESEGRAVSMGNSVPLRWEGQLNDLPDRGWDWAFEQAVKDHESGVEPNICCAIQIAIHPDHQGQGLSTRMIQHMREIARSKGFERLIAPVRPNQKNRYPLADIDRYVRWESAENLPLDAWLRVHCRAGARIVKVCHQSMTIIGKRSEWESWTGLAFPESGQYVIPGALNPIRMDLEADEGIYVEPNVWMVHEILGSNP